MVEVLLKVTLSDFLGCFCSCCSQALPSRFGGSAVGNKESLFGGLPFPQGPGQGLLRKGDVGREEGLGGGVRCQGP